DPAFDSAAFDEQERTLLAQWNGRHRDEWVTRFWCAKEAAGKAVGLGMRDGPATMVVRRVDPDRGTFVVTRGASADDGSAEISVHSLRDGDFVMAVAVAETNGNGHV
ncbi:MAG: 4'-phosphopantetheinyl transferase superfamily protein, partial [Phycisphaerae bacterium]